jgi:hypothetical protein
MKHIPELGVEIGLDTLWNCGSTYHVNMSTKSEAALSFLRRYSETEVNFGRYLNNRWPREARNFINDVSVLLSVQSMSPDSMRLTRILHNSPTVCCSIPFPELLISRKKRNGKHAAPFHFQTQ